MSSTFVYAANVACSPASTAWSTGLTTTRVSTVSGDSDCVTNIDAAERTDGAPPFITCTYHSYVVAGMRLLNAYEASRPVFALCQSAVPDARQNTR